MVKEKVKKLLKTIFIISVLLILIIPKQELATSKVKLGDINGDNKIDQTDIVLLLRHISATTNKNHEDWILTGDKLKAADITENNMIDTSDLLGVLRYIAANQSNEIAKKHPEWLELEKTEPEPEPKVEPKKEPTEIKVTSVKLNKTTANLYMGKSEAITLKATIEPSNATNQKVTWTTSDKSIATVAKAKIEGTYYIKTKMNDNVLSVEGNKNTNSSKIEVNKKAGLDSQKYELVDAGNGYYIIRVKQSGKVLDVQKNEKENSTSVIQYNLTGNNNQQWKLEDAGNGYKYIKSKSSGLYLDVQGGKGKAGDNIIIYESKKKDNQKFKLEKTGEGTNSEEGLVTIKAKKNGTATITAKVGNKEIKCKIKVTTPATSIKLNKTSMEIDFNKTKTAILKATVLPKTTTDKTITWSSSDTKVATVDKNGKVTAKKEGTVTITAKSSNGKEATCKVTVERAYWEVKNGKYIYHYLNGNKKEWTVSEYTAWNKLKEQNVKSQNPKAYTRNGNKITYLGISHYYKCDDNTANNIAIKNGGSPYAITVDVDKFHESIFENRKGLWEPIKSATINVGHSFSNEDWKKAKNNNPEIYSKKETVTPTGLFYTNGCNYLYGADNLMYWVEFGVPGRGLNRGENKWNRKDQTEADYFHQTGASKVGRRWTEGCISSTKEHAKWVYYHCGRGTPILIW